MHFFRSFERFLFHVFQYLYKNNMEMYNQSVEKRNYTQIEGETTKQKLYRMSIDRRFIGTHLICLRLGGYIFQ